MITMIIGDFIFKRRTELEVIGEFLNNASGIQRTNFLHKTGLSYKLFVDYLDLLLDKNLILEKEEGKSRVYFVTEKGSELLESITEIIDKLYR